MKRRIFNVFSMAFLSLSLLYASYPAQAADEAPDVVIQKLFNEVLEKIKTDKGVQNGDTSAVVAFIDGKISTHVNFTRMTASAVGRSWRQATPEQKKRLQEEFKNLLVRTYSGSLSKVKEQTVVVKPLRANPQDTEVLVRTEVVGRGEPIQLDYRMEKTPAGWQIYDLNVLGIWLVETYRTQFSQEIAAKGIDGLIAALVQRNKAAPASVPAAEKKA